VFLHQSLLSHLIPFSCPAGPPVSECSSAVPSQAISLFFWIFCQKKDWTQILCFLPSRPTSLSQPGALSLSKLLTLHPPVSTRFPGHTLSVITSPLLLGIGLYQISTPLWPLPPLTATSLPLVLPFNPPFSGSGFCKMNLEYL